MKLIGKLIGSVTLTGGLLLGIQGLAADDPATATNAPAQTSPAGQDLDALTSSFNFCLTGKIGQTVPVQ